MSRAFGTAGVSILAWLSFASLKAQNRGTECNDTLPTLQIDRNNGHVVPQERQWDTGPCALPTYERTYGSVISSQAQAHKPPKAARREFDRGVQFWRKGQTEEAVEHLKEAVRLDARFAAAQTQLGALYVGTEHPALALNHFENALALDPTWTRPNIGKASALLLLSRHEEAEQAARRALRFDPESIEAHYLLGVAMLMQDKITPETAVHLTVAADKYQGARTFLAEVQTKLGQHRTH